MKEMLILCFYICIKRHRDKNSQRAKFLWNILFRLVRYPVMFHLQMLKHSLQQRSLALKSSHL